MFIFKTFSWHPIHFHKCLFWRMETGCWILFWWEISFAQGGQIQNLNNRGLTERDWEVLKIMKSGPNLSIVLNWYDFST